jgi:hypothetical protein
MQKDKSMADDRDFIARSQSIVEKMHGRTATVEEMARAFAGCDPERRALSLDQLDALVGSDEPLTLNGARRLADVVVRRRALSDVHELLRKTGR